MVLAALVLLVALGCSAKDNHSPSTTTQPPTVEASDADNGKGITMSVGDTLKLTLTANHSTPFWWGADTRLSDPAVLQQTGHQYTASATTTGGPGSEFWTFKALKAGTSTIANQEASVSAPGGAPVRSFTAKVTVR